MDALSKIKLIGSHIDRSPGEWDNISVRFFKLILAVGILVEAVAIATISERIRKIGRESFEQHMETHCDPNNTDSPEALAYALYFGEFPTEVQSMEFGQGKTPDSFITSYGVDRVTSLPRRIFNELKTQKRVNESSVEQTPGYVN